MLDGQKKEFHDGEVIYEEGERGTEMYFIKAGRVRLMKRSQGLQVRLATLEEGDFFAEMALLDDSEHCATAVAQGEVTLSACGKQELLREIRENPELAMRMLLTMSERLRRVDKELALFVVTGQIPRHLSAAITRHLVGDPATS